MCGSTPTLAQRLFACGDGVTPALSERNFARRQCSLVFLAVCGGPRYIVHMDTSRTTTEKMVPGGTESDSDANTQLAREKAAIVAARAELDAGLYATSAEVKVWIDSIGTDAETKLPYPSQPRAR